MESLRIKNLKCFKDSGAIPIKPITILVGENSSGKSTFLRTFPLFRQSIEAKTRGPILWYGRYVDYGSFSDAIRKDGGVDAEVISFEFETYVGGGLEEFHDMYYFFEPYAVSGLLKNKLKLLVEFSVSNADQTYIDSMKVNIFDQYFKIDLNSKNELTSLIINGEDYKNNIKDIEARYYTKSFFPTLMSTASKNDRFDQPFLVNLLVNYIEDLTGRRLVKKSIYKIIKSFDLNPSETFLNSMKKKKDTLKTWRGVIQNWTSNTPDFLELRNLYLLSFINKFLQNIDYQFISIASKVHYIAPVRATAERYYRNQNLSIEEVDFQGKNLPMFIQAMSKNEKDEFQEWIKDNFNFIPDTQISEGHLSLLIIKDKDGGHNIADKGFGYSQVLPIITQLWMLIRKKYDKEDDSEIFPFSESLFSEQDEILFVVEQPELHLHPHLQACLVDAFIAAIKKAKMNGIVLKIIFETHSETMINWIGHRVADGEIDSNDIALVIFNQENENLSTTNVGRYDSKGFLENWPLGFFSPIRL
ncbi:MAG: hypothetical protein CVV48_12970 [Spirochaetae bacterium HGW-Spirochaetae-4]|nr:MAG: hypothetical protein CVV48_12970 [Spirochaetae bacterium HGW-Spirochaetae-4]